MNDDITRQWVAFVTADDRSGALTALAEMFSSRGVSFDSFNTLTVDDGMGVLSFIFRGSERLARVLARTLARLVVVRAVELRHADDERVRAIAVLSGVPRGDTSALDTVTEGTNGTVIVVGSFRSVRETLRESKAAGVMALTMTVMPAR